MRSWLALGLLPSVLTLRPPDVPPAPSQKVSGAPTVVLPCDGPEADPWVVDFRQRIQSYDDLFGFATDRYGPPTACEGELTMEFDGAQFGTLRLEFPGGVRYAVETMPPETSLRTLTADGGFEAPEAVRRAVESYAAGIGLHIDWSRPEVTSVDGEERRTFWDPDPGLNASCTLLFAGESLVGITISMAL